jgi:energy-coupling factor transport system ATP-binding protein
LSHTAKEVFSKVDFLHSIGLESPQGTELINALIKEGYSIKSDAITEDECFEALLALINSKGGERGE